jgi:hypothetical protein
MALHGSNILARFFRRPAAWVILSVTLLLIFIFRKKMITSKAEQIYKAARLNGFNDANARFVVAQAAHETGGFISPVFISNNNAFGMKYAGQALAKGEKLGYAWYETVEISVSDLAKWCGNRRINFFKPISTLADYVNFLKGNNYFEDTAQNYLKGCEHWYKQIFG